MTTRPNAVAMLRLAERSWAGRPGLLRMLADLEASGQCHHTVSLTPEALASRRATPTIPPTDPLDRRVTYVAQQAGDVETGLVILSGESRVVAVAPPFPMRADSVAEGADPAPLLDLLDQDPLVGVILLRLGRYAVGVLRRDALVASKTGSRYVKSRHRAGGSSQRRFERSRERLVRELFDKTCEVARGVFSPYEDTMDYVLLGGERHTIGAFVRRCRYVQDLGPKTLGRVLRVDRPGQDALSGIASEVWKSRVLVFVPEDPL